MASKSEINKDGFRVFDDTVGVKPYTGSGKARVNVKAITTNWGRDKNTVSFHVAGTDGKEPIAVSVEQEGTPAFVEHDASVVSFLGTVESKVITGKSNAKKIQLHVNAPAPTWNDLISSFVLKAGTNGTSDFKFVVEGNLIRLKSNSNCLGEITKPSNLATYPETFVLGHYETGSASEQGSGVIKSISYAYTDSFTSVAEVKGYEIDEPLPLEYEYGSSTKQITGYTIYFQPWVKLKEFTADGKSDSIPPFGAPTGVVDLSATDPGKSKRFIWNSDLILTKNPFSKRGREVSLILVGTDASSKNVVLRQGFGSPYVDVDSRVISLGAAEGSTAEFNIDSNTDWSISE